MGKKDQEDILRQGFETWNEWRSLHPEVLPNLRHTHLMGADLRKYNLIGASLGEANLTAADLRQADLTQANLEEALLTRANLGEARLCEAKLWKADLVQANFLEATLIGAELESTSLVGANFSGANLSGADLALANLTEAQLTRAKCIGTEFAGALLLRTNFEHADLTGAHIYGISAWDLKLTGTVQKSLIITPGDAPDKISVDDIEVAQLIYLLLNNDRVRRVIDTITSKVVLILGRFTPERKEVLDAVRDELRKRNYLPVVFDFDKPSNRDLTETVSTLAHMAKFVIADLTDAKSLPQELASIVPFLPSVPVQPILLASQLEWGMYEHFSRYSWVLEIVKYETSTELLANLAERVIGPAEQKLATRRPVFS